MEGPIEWAAFIFIGGLVATIAGTAGAVAWIVRGMQADLIERIMTTAEITTNKIAESRHFLRNEMHGHIGKLEDDFETGLGKLENVVTSVGAKLDMHRAEDATAFRELGERLAALEAAE